MSDTVDRVDTDPGAEAQLHPAEHDHPSEKQYFIVALILAVVTAIEVALYYVEMADNALVVSLGVLAIIKFVMVVMYFMHLKFDSPVFRRFFITGMVLAISVYVATLAAMHFFSGGTKFVTVS